MLVFVYWIWYVIMTLKDLYIVIYIVNNVIIDIFVIKKLKIQLQVS